MAGAGATALQASAAAAIAKAQPAEPLRTRHPHLNAIYPTPSGEGRGVGRDGGTCAQTSVATEVIDESPRASRRREAGCDIAQELVPFLKDEDDSQFEPDSEA